IVLSIKLELLGTDVRGQVHRRLRKGCDFPLQEICPCTLCRGRRAARSLGRGGDGESADIITAGIFSLLIEVHAGAELQRVLAANPRQVVKDVVIPVVILVRTETRRTAIYTS